MSMISLRACAATCMCGFWNLYLICTNEITNKKMKSCVNVVGADSLFVSEKRHMQHSYSRVKLNLLSGAPREAQRSLLWKAGPKCLGVPSWVRHAPVFYCLHQHLTGFKTDILDLWSPGTWETRCLLRQKGSEKTLALAVLHRQHHGFCEG